MGRREGRLEEVVNGKSCMVLGLTRGLPRCCLLAVEDKHKGEGGHNKSIIVLSCCKVARCTCTTQMNADGLGMWLDGLGM